MAYSIANSYETCTISMSDAAYLLWAWSCQIDKDCWVGGCSQANQETEPWPGEVEEWGKCCIVLISLLKI